MLLLREYPTFSNFIKIFRQFTTTSFEILLELKYFIESSIRLGNTKISNAQSGEIKKVLGRATQLKSDIEEWNGLESRTKSNELSSLTNIISAFTSPNVGRFFDEAKGKKPLYLKEILSGKIIVVTMPGTTDMHLASAMAKLLKAEYYRLIQRRKIEFKDSCRLCGIVMDEFPLIATGGEDSASDAFNMQVMRSKKAFLIAATQGLVSLDMKIGIMSRIAILTNFNNLFIFRSTESEVRQIAESFISPQDSDRQMGFLAKEHKKNLERIIFSTEDLPTGYAFVRLADAPSFPQALKLPRLFVDLPEIPKKVVRKQNQSSIQNTIKLIRDIDKKHTTDDIGITFKQ